MSSQAEFKIEHNVELNEIIKIELSEQEIAELEKTRKAALELSIAEQLAIDSKAAQRRAILDHLGITEEEARILLGGN